MKKTKFIVGVMLMLIGILAISPSVWATSFVWVEEGEQHEVVGSIEFNFDWEIGVDPLIVLSANDVEEFQWIVDGVPLADLIGDWDMTSLAADTSNLDTNGFMWQVAIDGIEGLYVMWGPWWNLQGPQVDVQEGFGHWEREGEYVIPEPSVLLLLGTGLIGLIALQRKVMPKR